MKTKCLIVDDEPLAVQLLKRHIEELGNMQLMGTCNNAIEASSFLMQNSIELLFLDIQMPRLTGIEFLKALKNPPPVILTTAHREFALDGYELDVIDYLLKPITFERFLTSIDKYYRRKEKITLTTSIQSSSMLEVYVRIKSGIKTYQFNESDILYIESRKDFIQIHLKDGEKPMLKYRLGQIEQELSESFIRIHKSFIINKKKINSFTPNSIEIGNNVLVIGNVYKSKFEQIFSLK